MQESPHQSRLSCIAWTGHESVFGVAIIDPQTDACPTCSLTSREPAESRRRDNAVLAPHTSTSTREVRGSRGEELPAAVRRHVRGKPRRYIAPVHLM